MNTDERREGKDKMIRRQNDVLEPTAFATWECVPADAAATHWLSSRIPHDGSLLLVFGSREVCCVPTSAFLERWGDLVLPSRDDVVIISERGDWVLFYSHEDEFEYGQMVV